MRILRVLLVDDDPAFLESAAATLAQARYSVASVSDFEAAASWLEAFKGRGVILADLQVKNGSALDFLSETLSKYPHLPFTILAASPSLESVIEALKQGAYDFLRKPVAPDILRHSVARSVEKLNLMLESARQEEESRRLLYQSRAELDKARTLSEFKGFLISTTAHDFNSALTVLDGYHQFIKSRCKDCPGPLAVPLLEQAGRSIARLRNMSATLLDFEAAEKGEIRLQTLEFDLRGLLEESISFYRPYAEQKRVILGLENDVPPVKAKGDPGRVMQILDNLLYNAVKFTPPKGEIRLGAREDDGKSVTVWVRDTGIGIAKKAMEKIFEKGGVGSDRDGSARVGLGLYICRRLVEIQNGRIWMESAPGVGTKVTFSLPV